MGLLGAVAGGGEKARGDRAAARGDRAAGGGRDADENAQGGGADGVRPVDYNEGALDVLTSRTRPGSARW